MLQTIPAIVTKGKNIMPDLERYTVTIPKELFRSFDERNVRKGYRNRSEAIRDLIRAALIAEQWDDPNETVAASITMVYDHTTRDLTGKINDAQLQYRALVVSALHVHLDEDHCLNVIVLRGKSHEIRELADALGCIKGVKHAQLSLTTDGRDLH